MFIRIKSRLNGSGGEIEYAYLVSNRWLKRRKVAKQKVSRYLGRMYRFSKVREVQFQVYGGFRECLKRLVGATLESCGFRLVRGRYWNGECFVDLKRLKVYNAAKRDCVVFVNDGFICSWSLRRLFRVEVSGVEDGPYLAKVLRFGGIEVDSPDFVKLFKCGVASSR